MKKEDLYLDHWNLSLIGLDINSYIFLQNIHRIFGQILKLERAADHPILITLYLASTTRLLRESNR